MKRSPEDLITQPEMTENVDSEISENQIPHRLEEGDIKTTLKSIADSDYKWLSKFAKLLLPFADTFELNSFSLVNLKNGYGEYNPNKNSIGIDITGVSERTAEDTARTILHEFIHALTVKQLGKYLNFKVVNGKTTFDLDNNNVYKLGEKNTPQHVKNLVKLFNYINNKFSKEVKLLNNKILAGQELDSDERRIYYGARNIMEFLTLATTSPEFSRRNEQKTIQANRYEFV